MSLELKRACDEVFQQRVGLRDGGHHVNADPSSELTEEQARRAFQVNSPLLVSTMLPKGITFSP